MSRQGATARAVLPFADAFDPNQPRGPDGKWIETGALAEADALIEAAHAKQPALMDLGGVGPLVTVNPDLGVDIEGFRHAIDWGAVRHIFKRHGNDNRERLTGNYSAITRIDIALLRSLLRRPSSVRLSDEKGANGQPRLEITARVGSVTYHYVGEVRRRRKRIDAITMFKR